MIAGGGLGQGGFDFVDVKHCHGYLGHEFSAAGRGRALWRLLENRTRFLREMVAGIRAEAPGLASAVRLSAVDSVPFKPDPAQSPARRSWRGLRRTAPSALSLGPSALIRRPRPAVDSDGTGGAGRPDLRDLDVRFVNVSAGSPYYNPHSAAGAVSAVRRLSAAGGSACRCVRQLAAVRD